MPAIAGLLGVTAPAYAGTCDSRRESSHSEQLPPRHRPGARPTMRETAQALRRTVGSTLGAG